MDNGQRTNLNQKKWNHVCFARNEIPFLIKWGYLFLAKIDDDGSVTSSFLILVAWEMLFY